MRKTLFFCFVFLFSCSHAAVISEKVIICGVCKNVAPQLNQTIEIMENIGSLFEDYRVVVYENNSTDKTPKILSRWAEKNPRVFFYSEYLECLDEIIINVMDNGSFCRSELIARARNIVLEKALSAEYEGFNYLIWMDMDFVLHPNYAGIVEVFQSGREWDAVSAYGVDPSKNYWDWYAFRDKVYPLGSELLGNEWWKMEKKLSLSLDDDWYPVYSAFGGCALYKKSSVLDCRYSGLVTVDMETVYQKIIQEGEREGHPQILKYYKNLETIEEVVLLGRPRPQMINRKNPDDGFVFSDDPDAPVFRMSSYYYQYPTVCEHVPFHAAMISKGYDKIFINPRLIFRYGQ